MLLITLSSLSTKTLGVFFFDVRLLFYTFQLILKLVKVFIQLSASKFSF